MRSRKLSEDSSDSDQESSPPPIHGDLPGAASSTDPLSVRARRRVYRVGGLKIPVKNPGLIQAPRSRFARKYKEILHRMERSKGPEEKRLDLDAFEPPIRRQAAPGGRPLSPRREPLVRRSETDRDAKDDSED